MQSLRWYHWLTLVGACLPISAMATIFKCSGPQGDWQYSSHRPTDCRGRVLVVRGIGDTVGRPRHRQAPRHRTIRHPEKRLAWLRADERRWRHTLRALLATAIPRGPVLRARRKSALERIQTRLRYDTTRIKMLERRRNR